MNAIRNTASLAVLAAAALVAAAAGCGSPADSAAPGEAAGAQRRGDAAPEGVAAATEPAAAPEAPAVPSAPVTDAAPAGAPAAKPAGDAAPDFTLTAVDGTSWTLSSLRGKVVVLEWVNHGCPYVKKHYGPGNMQRLQREVAAKGGVWLSICSSAPGKQGHMDAAAWRKANDDMKVAASAVLIDEDGKVGRLYGAKVTPHMFVVGADGSVVYRGAIDDRPSPNPKDVEGARNFVLEAVESALAGRAPPTAETRPYG